MFAHGGEHRWLIFVITCELQFHAWHYPDPSWLDAIEGQMAETGVAVAFARGELVALLRGIIAKGPAGPDAPFPNADITLEGTLEDLLLEGAAADLEDNYRALLARSRPRDRAAGRVHWPDHA